MTIIRATEENPFKGSGIGATVLWYDALGDIEMSARKTRKGGWTITGMNGYAHQSDTLLKAIGGAEYVVVPARAIRGLEALSGVDKWQQKV